MATESKESFEVNPAELGEIPAIVDFLAQARADMFPFLDAAAQAKSAESTLATFEKTFLDHPEGCFLVTRADGKLIATIGFVAYDDRFPQLQLGPKRVVEVVKLYVDPAWRRSGLGSKMFDAARRQAQTAGIEQLYLHTHPFLPGAIGFWERLGFTVIYVDDDPVWHTTHMLRPFT